MSNSLNIRPQYHFRPSAEGLLAWDVRELVILAAELTPVEINIDHIAEYNESYWHDKDTQLTCKAIAEHAQLINDADLHYPIILCHEGRLMDGMHRVCKAHLLGHRTILAVQFNRYVPPHHIGKQPDELPYE